MSSISGRLSKVKKRVLVTDDEKINQMILKKSLEQLGYQVTLANNGEEGIRCFKEEPFPLIIVDFNMPKVNGIDMVAEIRNLEKEIAPFIVGITTQQDPEFLKAGLKAGMNEVYIKPFNQGMLATICQ